MGNFSRDTFDELKRYVSVRMQQGVPLVDADWNEHEDIRKHELRTFLKWFVGNGVPKGNDGFRIVPLEAGNNDFTIKGGTEDQPGYCLVEGWDAIIEQDINYTQQLLYNNDTLAQEWGVEPLGPLSPPSTGERTDTVYLDVWEREVDAQEDGNLVNPSIGIETCVRLKREWVVRMAPGATEPPAPRQGHVYYPLASLKRTANQNTIGQEDLTDLRRTGVAVLSEEITIKDGNVGIGTSEPGMKLDVNGDISANNFYKLLPHNIISNSFMNRLKGNVPSGFNIGSYHAGNSTMQIEAVHPFTKGFEGPYVDSKPANAVDHVNDATGSNPYWFGKYYKGPRIPCGGMADGWGGRLDGNILKITGKRDTSDNSNPNTLVYVHFAKESRILTKALLFRAWIKIIKGSLHFGTDTYVTPEVTRVMTEAAPDGWYFINTIIDSLHITDLEGAYCFILKCFGEGANHEGDFEIYVALPYLANIGIDDSPHWSPSILDILSDYGTTIDLDTGIVGIGTTSREETLHVKAHSNGWAGGLTLTSQDNIGKWWIHPENSLGHALMFRGNDSDTRVIFRNCNMGIGKDDPQSRLDVDGDISGKSYRNVSQSFFVGGDGDKFYAVAFLDKDWGEGPAEFEIVRPNVHEDRSSWGAMNLTINWHAYSWGHGANFLEQKYRCSQRTFVKDIIEYIYNPYMLIWLRGSTTYYYRSLNNRVVLYNILGTDNQPCSFDPVGYTGYSTAVDAAYRPEQEGGIKAGTTIAGDFYATGNIYANNKLVPVGSSDYAEYFESKDGKEIKVGTAVFLDDAKIRPAKKNEIPIGVISASPGIVGGVHIEWPKKYLRDEFGNQIMEEYKEEVMVPKKEKVKKERQKMEKKTVEEKVTKTEIAFEDGKYFQKEMTETITRELEEPVFKEVDLYDAEKKNIIGKHRIPVMETYEEEIDVLDEKGQPVMVGTGKFETKTRPKVNPQYDETKEYIPREKRPEWNCVGLLGQLPLRKGQPVAPTWIKIKDISKDVELWLVK